MVEDAPDYDPADIPNHGALDEWFGDESSVAAQGTVTYQYASELPVLEHAPGLTFAIRGDAPGSTLVDLSLVDPAATIATVNGIKTATISQSTSSIIAGIENAATNLHADVISESYGSGGGGNLLWAADDAAVQAGTVVVASSGDEGFDNTRIAPADDPNVIRVGANTNMRLQAQAYGYTGWERQHRDAVVDRCGRAVLDAERDRASSSTWWHLVTAAKPSAARWSPARAPRTP